MKLYEEEKIIEAFSTGVLSLYNGYIKEILETLIPIELPSDEEIEEGLFHQSNEYAYGYKDAFNLIKNKYLTKTNNL